MGLQDEERESEKLVGEAFGEWTWLLMKVDLIMRENRVLRSSAAPSSQVMCIGRISHHSEAESPLVIH